MNKKTLKCYKEEDGSVQDSCLTIHLITGALQVLVGPLSTEHNCLFGGSRPWTFKLDPCVNSVSLELHLSH